jgi:hypothetical protein
MFLDVDNAAATTHSRFDARKIRDQRLIPKHSTAYQRGSIMPQVKAGRVLKPVRLPDEVFGWLEKRADYNGATISAEINIAVREKNGARA